MSVLRGTINLFLIVMILTTASCKKSSSNSAYAGNWKGTYTGTMDNGNFAVIIDNNGNVRGNITSVVFTQTYSTAGIVNSNGLITLAVGSASSGATFTGTLTGKAGKGTWINNFTNPPFSGDWFGSEQ